VSNWNINDIIVCKQSYKYEFYKGKKYQILDIHFKDDKIYSVYIKGESPFNSRVPLTNHGKYFLDYNMEVLFFSKNELRKQKLNKLMINKYVNHSGGANGADSYWDEIGREYDFNNHIHYWYKKMNPKSEPQHQVTEEDYLEGIKMIEKANLTLKRQHINKYMHLLARNWSQVKYSDSIYAIGKLKNTKRTQVNGGTGWAVQMAIDTKKDVYLFDQDKEKWFYWDYNDNKFLTCVTPTLTKNYAGIGTREISESGKNAIRNVYKKTKNENKSNK